MVSKGQVAPQKKAKMDIFLENLRGSSRQSPHDSLWQSPDAVEPTRQEERKGFIEKLQRLENVHRQEELLFKSQERETRLTLQALQEELKRLAAATANLTKEVQTAATQIVVEPGIYHQTFFEKLISFVKLLTQNVKDASVWMSASNNRKKRTPFYWAQAKKSGTKFTLSQERYMATQTG